MDFSPLSTSVPAPTPFPHWNTAMFGFLVGSLFAAALAQLPSVFAEPLKWDDCGSTLKITALRITGCPEMPCIFYKGNSYDIEFDALPNKPSTTLPYTVTTRFLFPVTLVEGDACQELSRGTCPIQPDVPFTFLKTFEMEFPLPTTTAGYSTMITAKMDSDYGDTLICAKLHIVIRSNPAHDNSPFSFFSRYFRSAPLFEEDGASFRYIDQGRMFYF